MGAGAMQVTSARAAVKTGFWAATACAVLAAVSLAVGVTTPPRTGPFAAPGTALPYPYSEAAAFVPRDFYWMYPALLTMLAFVILAVCVRERADANRRHYGTIGLSLAVSSFTVLGIDYFIQLRTVQPALAAAEAEGLAILSQYNPHGVFIALEELGFLTMALSFAFLGLALGPTRLERVTRWLLVLAAALAVLALVGMSWYYGLSLEYRFEVAAISIGWLTLIVAGALLAVLFRRSRREPPGGAA